MEDKMKDFSERLNRCRKILLDWSEKEFPNNKKVIEELREKLETCCEGAWTETKAAETEQVLKRIEEAWHREELFWWQKSRLSWIKYGDRNTKFFHNTVIQRRMRNKVLRLKSDEGTWVEEHGQISELFGNYYKDLFSPKGTDQMEEALGYISKVITDEDNCLLSRPVTEQEIEEAVFELGSTKALGPYGFTALFYQSAWEEVRKEVCNMVKEFFEGNSGLSSLNLTYIVLIPKVDKPVSVTQFRPIGLCNVSYKIVAKILTTRMKGMMCKYITEQQRAFVAGRLIQDNVIIAHEAFQYLKRRKKGSRKELALKIDLSKAYDRVDWNFLREVMKRMGFCDKWVRWIMECVTSIDFELLVSGKKVARLKPGRGVRQGDPLSPYLFIMVADVLSKMIQMHVQNGDLMGIRLSRGGPMLSHCFFADDALFFLRAQKENCMIMKKILEIYSAASGQEMNLDKSCIFFSPNATSHFKEEIEGVLGIKATSEPGKYLGLPLLWNRSKSAALGFVKDKIRKKLQGWKQKLLSFAGKEVLIKAVANSIPVYPMSSFLFPLKCCKEIDSLISHFWWGQNEQSGRRIHWKSWKLMTSSKQNGGMGFRSFQDFNKALLAKTAWRMIQNPTEFWCRILKGIYFPKCTFMEAKKGGKASWCWMSIMEGRELLQKQLFWKVGNGKEVRVWEDNWIPKLSSGRLEYAPVSDAERELKVAELIQNGRWDLSRLEGKITESEKEKILQLRITSNGRTDEPIWLKSKDGIYSVKSGYQEAKLNGKIEVDLRPSVSHQITNQLWKCVWSLYIPPKVKQFMWRMLNNALATKQALQRRKCAQDDICPICGNEVESVEHLILLCPWARRYWFGCSLSLQIRDEHITSIRKWCEEIFLGNKGISEDGKALVAAICWGIWKGRCDWVFNETMVDAKRTVDMAGMLVTEVWKSKTNNLGEGRRVKEKGWK